MARLIASEIVVALSEQNNSHALYLKNSFISMNSWRRCLLRKKPYTNFS